MLKYLWQMTRKRRRKWLSTWPILSYSNYNYIVPVAWWNGRNITPAFEDIHVAIDDSPLASATQILIPILELETQQRLLSVKNLIFVDCHLIQIFIMTTTWALLTLSMGTSLKIAHFPQKAISACDEQTDRYCVKYDHADTETLKISKEI